MFTIAYSRLTEAPDPQAPANDNSASGIKEYHEPAAQNSGSAPQALDEDGSGVTPLPNTSPLRIPTHDDIPPSGVGVPEPSAPSDSFEPSSTGRASSPGALAGSSTPVQSDPPNIGDDLPADNGLSSPTSRWPLPATSTEPHVRPSSPMDDPPMMLVPGSLLHSLLTGPSWDDSMQIDRPTSSQTNVDEAEGGSLGGEENSEGRMVGKEVRDVDPGKDGQEEKEEAEVDKDGEVAVRKNHASFTELQFTHSTDSSQTK